MKKILRSVGVTLWVALLPIHFAAQAVATEESEPVDDVGFEQTDEPPWYYEMQARLNLTENRLVSDARRSERVALWYDERDYEPLWIKDGKATNAAKEVVFVLLNAHEDGLIPSEYSPEDLFPKLQQDGEAGLADFEVSLSNAVTLYGQHPARRTRVSQRGQPRTGAVPGRNFGGCVAAGNCRSRKPRWTPCSDLHLVRTATAG